MDQMMNAIKQWSNTIIKLKRKKDRNIESRLNKRDICNLKQILKNNIQMNEKNQEKNHSKIL